jgi:UDP-N-acetylglucosamine 2-epimerase (non-hydrolysing)
MITLVAGARPNFMKIAPIWRALHARKVKTRFVHTGQHSDDAMAGVFLRELGLPKPDAEFHVGFLVETVQLAELLRKMNSELRAHRPDWLVVVGDVTSTLAAALAACKLGVPLAHVEAGLRSGDWSMAEEQNRVLVDTMADLHFTSSPADGKSLMRLRHRGDSIRFVGNTMVDSLLSAQATDVRERMGLPNVYALATLHRPVNVDTPAAWERACAALRPIADRMPVLLPRHPRRRARTAPEWVKECDPLSYFDMVTLMRGATLVATDSGGVQEETTALRIPCLTLRESTERPVTVRVGTNRVCGTDPRNVGRAVTEILTGSWRRSAQIPEGWDGRAGERIAEFLIGGVT